MSLGLELISQNEKGYLYEFNDPNNVLRIKLSNVEILFKPDNYRNSYYFKWNIDDQNIEIILKIESILSKYFSSPLTSNILIRNNYPKMLNTKLVYNKNNPLVIKNSILSVKDFIENNLDKKYNLVLKVGKIFVNKENIKYPLIIKNIIVSEEKNI